MDEPNCDCHGEPMRWDKDARYRLGGHWRCRVKHRDGATRRGRARGVQARGSVGYRAQRSVLSSGARNGRWKGDAAGYHAVHKWVNRQKEKTGTCSDCGRADRPTVWANLDGEYSRDPDTWGEKCVPCNKTDGVPKHPRFGSSLSSVDSDEE